MRGSWTIAAVVAGLLLVLPGVAHAASPSTSLAWYQGQGRGFTSDLEQLLLPSNATFSTAGTSAHVTVTATTDSGGFSVSVAAPPGRTLQSGKHYIRAQRAGSSEAGRPGVHVRAPSFDCWDASGSFEVRELSFAPGGGVQRAWIVFEIECGLSGPPVKGEARYGMPAPPAGSLAVVPAATRWPADDRLRPPTSRSVWVVGTNARSRIAQTSVLGSSAFGAGSCWPSADDPPNTCEMPTAYTRSSAGTHRSTLRITETGGATHDVELAGFTHGGTTRIVASSEHEDEWVGLGEQYDLEPDHLRFWATASRTAMELDADEYNAYEDFSAELRPVAGDTLQAGREYVDDAIGYESGHTVDITVNGHTCGDSAVGSFRVNELTFDLYERVRSLSISFLQRCGRGNYRFTGRWDWRAGDTTPLAPWMVADPSVQDAGPPSPPDTTISGGPQGTTDDTTPQFAFQSSRARSRFECRVDGVGWFGCESPLTTNTLAEGAHTFEVRARDAEGFVDPTPAVRTFTVDTTSGGDPPDDPDPPSPDPPGPPDDDVPAPPPAAALPPEPVLVGSAPSRVAERGSRLALSVARRLSTATLSRSGSFAVPGLRATCPAGRRSCRLRIEMRRRGTLVGVARLSVAAARTSTVRLRLPRRVAALVRRSEAGVVLRLAASLTSGPRTVRRNTGVRVVAR